MSKKSTGKKNGFVSRWRTMKMWDAQELNRVDLIISGLLLAFLFVTMAAGDLRLTGNRSFLLYEHFIDFYKASYEQSGGYYANYLPSTFIAYAIWNLPLYLLGHVPEAILTNSFINNMWYKLLPVILYFLTSHFIYRIGMEAGFGEKKSRLCKFAFLIFPIGVFSQFIFSQYDIFTVFFMVVGLYFYLKEDMWKFALMFGIAATFKYHAIVFFLVFLVLKEKKIRNMLKYAVIMALPLLIEVVPNMGDIHFQRHVMGFGALKFVQKSFTLGFFNGMNLLAAVAAFVLIWAYQRKTQDKEDLFSWGMFFCLAMSFAIFGFSTWNPQWLLIMVPFLVLNIFVNGNGNMLVMITNVFMLALYIFCSQNMVTESVLNFGILKYIIPGDDYAVSLWDVYRFHDEELLCAAMWVVLLAYVVFGHPRYHNRKRDVIAPGLIWQIRSAFLFGVFAFLLPLTVCIAGVYQGKITFFNNSRSTLEAENVARLDEDSSIEQNIVADGSTLSDIRIRVYNGEQSIDDTLTVTLTDDTTGEVVYEGEEEALNFSKNSALYSFLDESVPVEKGRTYTLKITSQAPDGQGIGLYCVTTEKDEELLQTSDDEGDVSRQLQMRVLGVS